jgi:hypothetical protein
MTPERLALLKRLYDENYGPIARNIREHGSCRLALDEPLEEHFSPRGWNTPVAVSAVETVEFYPMVREVNGRRVPCICAEGEIIRAL